MSDFLNSIKKVTANRHFKYGVPFITLVLGGSWVISKLATVRYDFRKSEFLTKEQFDEVQEKSGNKITVRPQEETTLEALHEEYMKNDFVPKEEFRMVRGPRPWEPTDSEWHEKRKANKIIKRVQKSKDSYNI